MQNKYLLYSIVDLTYTKALVVTNTHGTLHYASLGENPENLLLIVKKDFSHLKGYVLQPIIGKANKEIRETTDLFKLMAEDPRKINEMAQKIRYEYIFGTELQRKVWDLLITKTEALKTLSYSDIAIQLDMPKSSRVIGNACGANKIALLIPCHRAITKLGKITGYRWGLPLKKKLLALELV